MITSRGTTVLSLAACACLLCAMSVCEGTSVRQPSLQGLAAVHVFLFFDPLLDKRSEGEDALEQEIESLLTEAGLRVENPSWATLQITVNAEALTVGGETRLALFLSAALDEPVIIKRTEDCRVPGSAQTWTRTDSTTCAPPDAVAEARRMSVEAVKAFIEEVKLDRPGGGYQINSTSHPTLRFGSSTEHP